MEQVAYFGTRPRRLLPSSQDPAAALCEGLIYGRYIPEQCGLDGTIATAAEVHAGLEDPFSAKAAQGGIANSQFSACLPCGVCKCGHLQGLN
jgi:hypothetical protein